ncbi:unnamed protein product [Chondrus crispus]|uniref:Uncharacterized protein n=1 Tax=Chondrus crispus TaxID=2769 RepID=R7Q9L3_CHOCR|nr:unnamed protein product [Chondrus crispus]CDF34061.1 unnamed protein product [Chondrus crispus]|eukprot:XP_005713880.1 unnamed protein product [Chondrus crispus]
MKKTATKRRRPHPPLLRTTSDVAFPRRCCSENTDRRARTTVKTSHSFQALPSANRLTLLTAAVSSRRKLDDAENVKHNSSRYSLCAAQSTVMTEEGGVMARPTALLKKERKNLIPRSQPPGGLLRLSSCPYTCRSFLSVSPLPSITVIRIPSPTSQTHTSLLPPYQHNKTIMKKGVKKCDSV